MFLAVKYKSFTLYPFRSIYGVSFNYCHIVKHELIFSFYITFVLIFLLKYDTIIVLHNFINLNGLYVGKNVGLARHIRSGVKLSSNNERNCVFRCVVSATHFLIFGGKANEKNITYY